MAAPEEVKKRPSACLQSFWAVYLLDAAALLAVPEEAKGQPRQSCLLAEGIQKHRVAAAGQETAQDTECRKQLGSTR